MKLDDAKSILRSRYESGEPPIDACDWVPWVHRIQNQALEVGAVVAEEAGETGGYAVSAFCCAKAIRALKNKKVDVERLKWLKEATKRLGVIRRMLMEEASEPGLGLDVGQTMLKIGEKIIEAGGEE